VEATHSDKEKTYGLLENGYAYDVNQQLGGDSVSDYTVTLTIKADTYLSQYNKDVDPDHTLASGEGDKTITLRYKAQKWVVDTDTPVTFNVTCEEETPDIPDVNVEDLGDEVVTINCINTETSHPEMKSAILGEILGEDYSVAYGADKKTATITIISADKYVEAYNNAHDKP